MNKEECKTLIVEQFKNVDSPIRYLALQPDMQNRDNGTHFRNETVLVIDKFKMFVKINTTTNLDGETKFSVLFEDFTSSKLKPTLNLDRIDKAKSSVYQKEYIFELIEYEPNGIRFTLWRNYIEMKDYVCSVCSSHMICYAFFDFKKCCFDDAEIAQIFNIMDLHRTDASYYLDFALIGKDNMLFIDFLDNAIKNPTKRYNMDVAFRRTKTNGTKSTMQQIMENLVRMP